MKKITTLFCAGFIATTLISCFPSSTDLNKEDYGSRPEVKAAPAPSLADMAGAGQKFTPATTPAVSTPTVTTAPAIKSEPKKELDGQALIAKSDCLVCHKLHEKAIGPAYDLVAKKYEPTDANITMLAGKVIKGGTGVWGAMPMTPHADLALEDAKAMVKYILSVK